MALSRAVLATSATALLLATANAPARAETLTGRAGVIDGETLEIRGTRIRLSGIDVPESDQVCESTDDGRYRCGQRAVAALDQLLEESIVTCVGRERDPLGRIVAVCSVGPVDLSLWLIRNGFARTPLASNARYRRAQDEARAARRGIWSEGGAGL